ncbi:Hypothetical predicted protein [Mytilus galloprovincialis]|uniref:Uncharacterized protein n=1 Tax=Mytilus galloprovincialis TaxID=29158 RepID=A0A8B6HM38_MYTGA|nr:Hypothetical predicted protein [Mytilus galloprovincialis]
MPPKRQSSYGVAGAIKKMKTAAQRKKTSTAIPSGPSIPPNNATVISPDVMEELTNRVTERVASRMERRMEEIFDKIASKNNGNSDVQQQVSPSQVSICGQSEQKHPRKLIERGEAQWGSTHLELYLRAKLQGKVITGNDNNKSGNTRWPSGVCFSFIRV